MGGSSSRSSDAAHEARRNAERAAEQARRESERARMELQQARRDANQARREAQEAQNWAQRDSSAREQAEGRAQEARQRQEGAERARQEAERAARSWEEAAANAEQAREAAEQAKKAAEERLRQGIPPEIRPTSEQMQQSRERHGYGTHALNIAVVGESGVGKSALLNAVRGLWPEDPGAAAVGVDETTADVQGYVDPSHPHVKWFDVPGANTPNISGWLYFMNQSLYIFDVLIILFSDRFTQTVGTLLSNAHQCSIPTMLVRSKADQLIRNLKKDRRGRLTDADAKKIFIDRTRDMVYKNLSMLKLPLQPVFVVSEEGMRDWVTARNSTNVIDEQAIYQSLFPESTEQESSLPSEA
jgi:glucan-binding YG repeat protein